MGCTSQDTWKVTPRLTLDYGLRWDHENWGHEIYHRWVEFGPNTPNPTVNNIPGALIYEGNGPGRCNCLFTNTYPYAIGPRLGVAYQIDSKTVFRGGIRHQLRADSVVRLHHQRGPSGRRFQPVDV